MNNKEFAEKLISIAKDKTIYALGGYGQKATAYNKALFKTMYSKNRTSETISQGIANADAKTSMYDCNGLVKSTLNGNKGYTTKPCPDVNIEAMLNACTDVSTNMNDIQVGEYLVYADKSHCGIYIGIYDGKRCAVECTYRWDNGVQIIDIDREERKDMWKYHGKLSKYITYIQSETVTMSEYQYSLSLIADVLAKVDEGCESAYVKNIQQVLYNDFGYKYVDPCGYYGSDTKKAIKDFQTKHKIEATGVVDFDTLSALIGK